VLRPPPPPLESLGGGNARTSSSVRGKGREAEAAADSRECKGRKRNVEGGRTLACGSTSAPRIGGAAAASIKAASGYN